MTTNASWPTDYAVLNIPRVGERTINTTWPYIAVTLADPDDPKDTAFIRHTDDPTESYDILLTRLPNGDYKAEARKEERQ